MTYGDGNMEPEDQFDEYETEEELAEEFGEKPGVVERVKAVAKRKHAAAKERAAEERAYQAYKHPDAAEVAGVEQDYSKAPQFAKRKASEDAAAATRRVAKKARMGALKRRAKAGVQRAAKRVKTKARAAMRDADRPKKAPGLFEFGGGGILADPMGRGTGKAPSFELGFGGGRKARGFELGFGGDFSLFGEPKKPRKQKPRKHGKRKPKKQGFSLF